MALIAKPRDIYRYHLKKAASPWTLHNTDSYNIVPQETENPKRPPPFNLTIYKGQKNAILSRSFVKYAAVLT